MEDSAAVAGLLWDHWLPVGVRGLVAEVLPGGVDDARRLVVWLAAVHDIGKATPAFACQVDALADRMRAEGLEMKTLRQFGPEERRKAPHGLAGQVLLGEWLEERHGWTVKQSAQFAVVPGGHHGVPPDYTQLKELNDRPHLLRTPGASRAAWQRVQYELLDACADEYDVRQRLDAWRTVKLPQPVQVLLTALVIVSDWIASNPDLFPYFPQETRTGEERIAAAWRGLNLPSPWQPDEPPEDAQELFSARFDLPPGAKVRPVQEAAVRLARAMPTPGLMVIEAPMGEGKTEAALAVAEIFAVRSGAGGVFFALPTMATGNAMFPRLLDWLERLPAQEGARLSVLLAHSKAALNEDYADLMRVSRQSVVAVDSDAETRLSRPADEKQSAPAELVAHMWLRGRKKAMLSSFVAGTVDQLLFAGLKSRHLALRHLAVAGKVVVIDEAHAYDTYMSAYLDRVLSWLGAYRVPVVVLSATLPAARRRQLAEAYAGAAAGSEAAAAKRAAEFEDVARADGYPLLTAVAPGQAPVVERPEASARGAEVQVETLGDNLDVLAERLATELDGGGCALVVRNTVKRVLDTAKVLRERFGDEQVTVAHSSFIDVDRAAKDADLLLRFGPPGRPRETRESGKPGRGRPAGPHIVVASQVAEQSLDVDFDLLVTDLCPVDLMLQRMGRLHRHQRGVGQADRPEQLRTARCLITGIDWSGDVPVPVRGSVAVYGAYPLLRSAAVLLPHLTGATGSGTGRGKPVRLPQDISPLVQGAYAVGPAGPESWAEAMATALERHKRHRADQAERAGWFRLDSVGRAGRPLIGWIAAGVGDADDTRAGRAQVRDSKESLEVIVVQRRSDDSLATLPWLSGGRGGQELPGDRPPSPAAARAAAGCGLRLPIQFSYAEVMDRAIAELEELYVPAWQTKDSHWLAGQLILALDVDCQTRLAGFLLKYSKTDGLEVTMTDD
ncbi:CRISPR-associated helicase Cas3' [Streptomyces sp. NPDC056909]|uniref:CRISPR-associated helicase Cas3' n=1 Tax=Streptomyces sp. NPDC056909 TaxID=3345963 RepID=UPI0036900A2D